ncbi:MAG TPA: ribose-5-phosphate isomerase RpiA [Myxococcales bacterium]|nr:ribose-5-phosphate isomerase RpiA [Myxococcales bacterium]HIK86283.1 ribose-5-phosphate isomerase RpiA [Myxococcales bacterium]
MVASKDISAGGPDGDGDAAALSALEWVRDGMKLGLGTGRAAAAFVRALGARVADGLSITGVPTSDATAELAKSLGIPLTKLEDLGHLDITFDGADEVDPQRNVIKGYGAAMVREKIVAASSSELVILIGPEKLVTDLGERGRLPIEILPFGEALVRSELEKLGLGAARRVDDHSKTIVTDNGNWILDAKLETPLDANALESAILTIPGVLGTGFFLGMADAIIIGDGDQVEVRR